MKRIPVLTMLTALLALWTIAVFGLVPSVAEGAVPQLINFQGILKDGSGNPVANGSYAVRFTIYDAASFGTVLWSESTSVSTTSGLFTVLLGAVTPVPDSAFNDSSRYLGIKVGADAEMAPRQKLTSVGYTFRTEQWTSAGQNLFRLSGNVGIGTASPEEGLHIGGSATQSRILLSNAGNLLWESTTGANIPVLQLYSDNNVYLDATAAATSDLIFRTNTGLTERMRITDAGNVGIGTTSPANKLSVAGNADFTGNVGIGTAPSVYRLFVIDDGTPGATAVYGFSAGSNGNGVVGVANTGSSAYGVWGRSSTGYAGYFDGNVNVAGSLSKTTGSFKIDHPLDPANQYLYHSFVESPDMMNIYNGVVVTDAKGNATVTMPDWFGALNKDFRYQLTCIGGFAQVYVAEEVKNNQFKVAGGTPGMKVSWQVTGIRQDVYANAHRIPVEEVKSDKERGYYLHPDLFGQPEEKGTEWARHPEMMKEMKEMREKAKADK